MVKSIPHYGLHVADLAVATRFYVEALGFEPTHGGRADIATLLEIEGAVALTQFVRHPSGMVIELWTLEGSAPTGDDDPSPANRRGRPHLCLMVENLDETAARIVALGGRRLDGSRCELQYGPIMFCADPDGVRLELVQA
jgi:catechol 2,3-dioxygenase-like lactoylglutathione lyase family enzyme